MNQLFKKSSQLVGFLLFVSVWLTACGKKEEIHSPSYNYNGRPVYTTETLSNQQAGKNILFCVPAGMLAEIYNYRYNHSTAVNVFDRKTGKPVFCDPTTGKVLE